MVTEYVLCCFTKFIIKFEFVWQDLNKDYSIIFRLHVFYLSFIPTFHSFIKMVNKSSLIFLTLTAALDLVLASSVQITSPKANAVYEAGSTVDIKW